MKKIIFTIFCITATFASSMAAAEKPIARDSHQEERERLVYEIKRCKFEIRQNARKIAEGKLSTVLQEIYCDDLDEKYSNLYALEHDGRKLPKRFFRPKTEQAIEEAREMLEKDIWYPYL